MAPAPLHHSFTEGYVDKIGSSNAIEANLPISPALQPAYRRTKPQYLPNQCSTFLQAVRPLRFSRTDTLGSIRRNLTQRSTSVAANTATQKGITIPQRIAVNNPTYNSANYIQ
jgi:hypothetical protein